MLEFLYLPKMDVNRIKSQVTFINEEVLNEALSKGNGIFFISAHYANWELEAFSYPRIFGSELHIIAKKQASRGLNEKINEFRELSGNKIIEIGYSLKEIFSLLDLNKIVCFLVDQSAHPEYSAYIRFFGISVPAFAGPAKIALRKRPEIIIAWNHRSKGKYKVMFERLDYSDLKDSGIENIVELTQRMQTAFENVIRNDPGQWLWFHRRFKHRKEIRR